MKSIFNKANNSLQALPLFKHQYHVKTKRLLRNTTTGYATKVLECVSDNEDGDGLTFGDKQQFIVNCILLCIHWLLPNLIVHNYIS